MSCRCSRHSPSFQPFPVRGSPLGERIDLFLPSFPNGSLPLEWVKDRVFGYVLTTVDIDNGKFRQQGGAPNMGGNYYS